MANATYRRQPAVYYARNEFILAKVTSQCNLSRTNRTVSKIIRARVATSCNPSRTNRKRKFSVSLLANGSSDPFPSCNREEVVTHMQPTVRTVRRAPIFLTRVRRGHYLYPARGRLPSNGLLLIPRPWAASHLVGLHLYPARGAA